MLDPVRLSHLLVQQHLRPEGVAVDATVGNGHDTLFLARHLGPRGRVHGFDIQPRALAAAGRRLAAVDGPLAELRLHACGHEQAGTVLAHEGISRIDAVMFNLGYLPGGDKTLCTQANTTAQALREFRHLLAPNGIISVVAYVGHPGAIEERDAVLAWAASLEWPEWATWRYTALNRGCERAELLAIERLAATGYGR